MFFQRLRADERGANAIEYAIIGALIGIGLIGSLIGTKTSLSAIFGTAAGQMGSASAGDPTYLPTTNIASKWSSKALVSKSTSGTPPSNYTTSYTFSDGSSVSYNLGSSGRRTVTMIDPTTDPYKTIIIQPDGAGGTGAAATNPFYIANTLIPASGQTPQRTRQDQMVSNATNTGTVQMDSFINNGNGSTYQASTVNRADYAKYFNDAAYFSSIQ